MMMRAVGWCGSCPSVRLGRWLPFHTVSLLAPEPVTSVALSPQQHLIATTGPADAVRLWNAATLEPARVLTAPGDGANSVAFSPDGRLLAAAGAGGYVRLWDPATGAQLATLPTPGSPLADPGPGRR
jgi:WD40 repeat protein